MRNLKADLERWPPHMEMELRATCFSGGWLRLELRLARTDPAGAGSGEAPGHTGMLVVELKNLDEVLLHDKVDFATLQEGALVRVFGFRPLSSADSPQAVLGVVGAVVCDEVIGRDVNSVLQITARELSALKHAASHHEPTAELGGAVDTRA